MHKYAQILNNKVHWIMEHEANLSTLYKNYFNKDQITFIDITNIPDIQEGYSYDAVTGTFIAPVTTLTKSEQIASLDAAYQPQFADLATALGLATLGSEQSLIDGIKFDYAALKAEYQEKLEAIENG